MPVPTLVMRFVFCALVGVTLFFSLSPGHVMPAVAVNHDKLAHFIVFFVLSLCMTISFPTHAIKRLLAVMVLLAVGIEVVQSLFTNRESSVIDFGASFAGILVYLIVLKTIARKFKLAGKTINVS